MKLSQAEIGLRLARLYNIIDWVLTDVTSSIDEKTQADRNITIITSMMEANQRDALARSHVEYANELWEQYNANLTGSNVPKKFRTLPEREP